MKAKTTYVILTNGNEVEVFTQDERRTALGRLNFYNVTQHIDSKTGERNLHELFRRVETQVRQ